MLKSYPCWGARTNLSSEGLATGSINKVAIPHGEADGLDEGMGLSARTFGEASINLTKVVGAGECVTFGSAYLKSRSSDSFNAALKDFIPPLAMTVSNCAGVKIRKKDDAGELLPGAEFTLYKDNAPKGEFDAGDTAVLDSDNAPLTCTTAANGECSFTLIFEGDYCAVETDHPDHYLPADPECFTVGPAIPILTVDFIDRRLGSVLVKKSIRTERRCPVQYSRS
ncbi:prealbumin-like fold domain-containing protein [Marinobacterium aestuariivivens]|uniref:Prealbumin-like fold domain-containing protein n=1 Tax=Marinobacterium aestuariivivens TaxID=1698799 RepID=A0ABW1ZUX2_9GAMM